MRRLLGHAFWLAFAIVACKKADDKAPEKQAATDACPNMKSAGELAWIHDDYAGALACAKQKGVPLVVDFWAPWCHTCLSMQATVLTDPSFKAVANKFVFVELDTDREVNAAVVDRYPLSAWPTFYVIGPDEKVLARFVGAATVTQFHAFLEAGARAMSGAAVGPDEHLLNAERAIAGKDLATAESELTAAIAAAPATWPRRPDALNSLVHVKQKRKDYPGCLDVAEKYMDETGNAASATDFTSHATDCARDYLDANKDQPEIAARVKALRERAVAKWRQLADDKTTQMSIDDRSDVMLYMRDTLIALERKDEAKQVAEAQRAMLDDAAAKATDPMHAMTYNWPRAEVYVFLDKPLELVPALEKSIADLPKEYDPPTRLGWIYLKAGKLAEAAKYTDQALALAYGPRKVRVLTQRAEIAQKQGDKDTERAMRAQVVKMYESLPAGQTSPEQLAKAKEALAKVDAPAEASSGSGSGT
ncbi:MAG TPA: thioredoxin family protein [Kofleriaceae bacterium]|nr:thioredoxin family protein [Kofleriaceae bacterium]